MDQNMKFPELVGLTDEHTIDQRFSSRSYHLVHWNNALQTYVKWFIAPCSLEKKEEKRPKKAGSVHGIVHVIRSHLGRMKQRKP